MEFFRNPNIEIYYSRVTRKELLRSPIRDAERRRMVLMLGSLRQVNPDAQVTDAYTELLNRAVTSLKLGKQVDLDRPANRGADINLHVPALLNDSYIPDVHMRLILYKRMASVTQREELNDLQAEIIDRFGLLPEAGKVLFRITELKLLASALGILKVETGPKGARVEFEEKPNIDPAAIIRLLQSAPRMYKLDGPNRLRILGEMPDADTRIAAIRGLIEALS